MPFDLLEKNICLISPRYFDYEMEIKKELEHRGAKVHFIDDRMKNNILNKALFRLKLREKIGKQKVFNYFISHLKGIDGIKIDYLIAIVPEGFSKSIVEYYKKQLKDAVFILYMWDSIGNKPYIFETLDLYDKAFTFDRNDAANHGLIFRPLFYTDDYRAIGLQAKGLAEINYDLSFIGTVHSDRYRVIKELAKSSTKKLRNYFFFYLQHPILIVYNFIFDRDFRDIKFRDVSFKSLSKTEVLSVIRRSLCVVDINHPRQTGLTIRTLEVLGAKRKLITTNRDIVNYDFYEPENMLLIDRGNPVLDETFLKAPYKDICGAIYDKYSISSWVDQILSL